MRVGLSLCSATVLLCGCYASTPVQLSSVVPGQRVVVALTDAGSDSLTRYLGPGVATVDGKLLTNGDPNLSLAVSQITMRSGVDQFWKGETVALPRSSVATVQTRSLSKPRTGLLVAAFAVALATVRLSGVGTSNSGKPGTGGNVPK